LTGARHIRKDPFNSESDAEQRLDTIKTIIPDQNGLIWIFATEIFAVILRKTGETKSYLINPVNEIFRNSRGDRMLFE